MSHHLLVVEDDADIRQLLELMLRSGGHPVETADDGPTALRLASRSRPRLVITDLRMPAMDGIELIRELRRRETLARVPVIIFTAFSAHDARVRTILSESDTEVVTKGSLDPLRQAVARLLHRTEES